jgi:REP element-mobilizing transposase RayT
MAYDPHKHYRRSIRLKGYDYSQEGLYFVTICVQRGQCLLTPTAVQEMICLWWEKLPDKFTAVALDAFVIMPNHIHFIVAIKPVDTRPFVVGARPCARLEEGQTHGSAPTVAALVALGTIVQWFKTMTTNAYIRGVKEQGWESFPGRLWQRNYYEQIIKNERHLTAVREYIANNLINWETDQLHPNAPLNKFNQLWQSYPHTPKG